MRKLVKIPSAGLGRALPLALPVFLAFCGVASSQEITPDIVSTQNGDVFSETILNVETVSDSTTGIATATGISLLGGAENSTAAANVQTTVNGIVSGQTQLLVGTSAAGTTTLRTTATGAAVDVNMVDGGSFTANVTQQGNGLVTSNTDIAAGLAQTETVVSSAQSIGNSNSYGSNGATINSLVSQTLSNDVVAATGTTIQYVGNSSAVSASTVGNNVTAVGTNGSSMTHQLFQNSGTGVIEAVNLAAYGTANLITSNAAVSANNVNMLNVGDSLVLDSEQANGASVNAEVDLVAAQWGGASATAMGVGNSLMAGNEGRELILTNLQSNTAGSINATASFVGGEGYDSLVSATALGNAVTGYACAECNATASIDSRQQNNVSVTARANTLINTSARNVTGQSSATGNSATFYTSAPGN